MDEARKAGQRFVGTEHLLLGLLQQNDNVSVRLAGEYGITYEAIHSVCASAFLGPTGDDPPRIGSQPLPVTLSVFPVGLPLPPTSAERLSPSTGGERHGPRWSQAFHEGRSRSGAAGFAYRFAPLPCWLGICVLTGWASIARYRFSHRHRRGGTTPDIAIHAFWCRDPVSGLGGTNPDSRGHFRSLSRSVRFWDVRARAKSAA
ncbi:MAG: Clp protease N-terminal domain-containing protein [Dehalococcoidia bacterium]